MYLHFITHVLNVILLYFAPNSISSILQLKDLSHRKLFAACYPILLIYHGGCVLILVFTPANSYTSAFDVNLHLGDLLTITSLKNDLPTLSVNSHLVFAILI